MRLSRGTVTPGWAVPEMTDQYWYPPRSGTRCGATPGAGSVPGEELRELVGVLLEVADHEALEDRRGPSSRQAGVHPDRSSSAGVSASHPGPNGEGRPADPVEQLARRQRPVAPDAPDPLGSVATRPNGTGSRAGPARIRSTCPSQNGSISATWARTSLGPQSDSGSAP